MIPIWQVTRLMDTGVPGIGVKRAEALFKEKGYTGKQLLMFKEKGYIK